MENETLKDYKDFSLFTITFQNAMSDISDLSAWLFRVSSLFMKQRIETLLDKTDSRNIKKSSNKTYLVAGEFRTLFNV